MRGTESPDFDRLAEMREVLREAREDRAEIALLRREKEILAIAIQLATREKAELLKQIQLKTQHDVWDFCPFCGRAHPDATETKETHHGK